MRVDPKELVWRHQAGFARQQAYEDGRALAESDAEYRRDWDNPYVTMAAQWAMVAGYEEAWNTKRAKRGEQR